MNNEKNRKSGGINEPLGLHIFILQKIQELFSYWLQLLTCLVQADFLLVE